MHDHEHTHDDLLQRLDAWGLDQRNRRLRRVGDMPRRIVESVRGAAPRSIRFRSGSLLALAACLVIAGLVAALTVGPRGGAGGAESPGAGAARPTLLALMRDNGSLDAEELSLPPATVVSWTSRAPALR